MDHSSAFGKEPHPLEYFTPWLERDTLISLKQLRHLHTASIAEIVSVLVSQLITKYFPDMMSTVRYNAFLVEFTFNNLKLVKDVDVGQVTTSVDLLRIGMLPWPHLVARGCTMREVWTVPRSWSSARVLDLLQKKRDKNIEVLTKTILQRIKSCGRTSVVKALVLRVVDILFSMMQFDFDDIDVHRDTVIAYKNDGVSVRAHMDFLRVRPLRGEGLQQMLSMKHQWRLMGHGCTVHVLTDNKDGKSALGSDGRASYECAATLMHPFDGEATLTLPALGSLVLHKGLHIEKKLRIQLHAARVVVELTMSNVIACFHILKLQKLHILWLQHIYRCSEMILGQSAESRGNKGEYAMLYVRYLEARGAAEKEQLQVACRALEGKMSPGSVQHMRGLAMKWNEDISAVMKCFDIQAPIGSEANWADVNFGEVMMRVYSEAACIVKPFRFMRIDVCFKQLDLRLSTAHTAPYNPRKQHSQSPPEDVADTAMSAGDAIPRPQRRGSVPPNLHIDIAAQAAAAGASRGTRLSEAHRRPILKQTGAPQLPEPVTLFFYTMRMVIVKPFAFSRPWDQNSVKSVTVERFSLHAGKLHESFTEPATRGSGVEGAPGMCRGLYAGQNEHGPEAYLQRAIIDKCEILGCVDKEGEEAEEAESRPMLHVHVSEDLVHDIANGWNKYIGPDVHIQIITATICNAVVVVDTTNIAQLVAYMLPVAESLSAVSTFWKDSSDLVPPPRAPSPVLPGSVFSGRNARFSMQLSNVGVAIKDPKSTAPQGMDNDTLNILHGKMDLRLHVVSMRDSECVNVTINNINWAPYLQSLDASTAHDSNPAPPPGYLEAPWYRLKPCSRICADSLQSFCWEMLWSLRFEIEKDTAVRSSRFPPSSPAQSGLTVPFSSGINDRISGPMNVRGNLRRYIRIRSLPYTLNISEQEVKILLNFSSHTASVLPVLQQRLMIRPANVKEIVSQVLLQSRVDKFRSFVKSVFRTEDLTSLGDITEKRLRALYEPVLSSLNFMTSEKESQMEHILRWYDCSRGKATSSADFEQKSFNLFLKSSVVERGPVALKLSEYTGAHCPPFMISSLKDGRELNELWSVLEKETGLRRSSSSLGNLSPVVVQTQLVRLCRDEALARALWENIISRRLMDSQFEHGFPWVLSEDQPIVCMLSAEEVIDRATMESASTYSSSTQHMMGVWSHVVNQDFRHTASVEVDMSSTGLDVDIAPIKVNYVDLLLGPREPRFQLAIVDVGATGGIAHYGVFPDLVGSIYSVVSTLSGQMTSECVYFNTDVGTMEPFLEPYTVGFSILKSPTEDTMSVVLRDSGHLVCNLSAALIQTVTSIALGLNQTTSFKYFPEDTAVPDLTRASSFSANLNGNRRRAIRPLSAGPGLRLNLSCRKSFLMPCQYESGSMLPSLVVYNYCGIGLTFSLYVSSGDSSITSPSLAQATLLRILKIPHSTSIPIHVRWRHIYKQYSDNSFPSVILMSNDKDSDECFACPLIPLHAFTCKDIFMMSAENTQRRPYSGYVGKHSNYSCSSRIFPFMMDIGVVLDRHMDGQYDCDDREERCWGSGNKYMARSNIQVQNGTEANIRLRIYDPDHGGDDHRMELVIPAKQKKAIPLNILQNSTLQYAFYCEVTHCWLQKKNMAEIICAESGRVLTGLYVLYIKSSLLSDSKGNRRLMDHTIEVTGGFKFVNTLPYTIELKFFLASSERLSDDGGTALREERAILHAGHEIVLPISLRTPEASAMKVRMVCGPNGSIKPRSEKRGERVGRGRRNSFDGLAAAPMRAAALRESEKWSEEVSLGDVLKTKAANTVEDTIIIPTYFTNAAVEVKVLKIRDPRRENLQYMSQTHASCMVIIYADAWIQNNSGIPLAYKVRTTNGDTRVVSDTDSGNYDLGDVRNPLFFGVDRLQSPVKGPVIAPLDAKYLRVSKPDSTEGANEDTTSLQKFGRVKVHPPVRSGRSKCRTKIFLSASVRTELRCGNIWLGVSVHQAPGIFSRTYIVVLTPRFIIQNLTSFRIMVFPVRVMRAATMNSLLKNYDNEEKNGGELSYKSRPAADSRPPNDDMARSAMAKLTSLQMSRNWSSYAVLDTDEITVTDGANDIDTTASPREVGGTPRDQYHEILRVNPDSATAFFCFNEESSFISSYVRALYYSAVSLKVTYGDLATSELTHMRELCEYLQVDVVSASDLAIADYIGTSDPYCVIFWQGERIFKTPHVNRNLNPEWNCTFYIPLCDEDVHSCELRLCVYDYDGNNTFINDDFLGQVNLDQGDMPWNKGRLDRSFNMALGQAPGKLATDNKRPDVKGKIKFRLSRVRKPFNYWTAPIRVGQPCTEYISARSVRRCRHMLEVTVKDVDSMRVISIREHSLANPPAFKIVNRLPDLRVRFRQLHTDPTQYPRSSLSPAEYSYYAWDNTTLPKVLAVSAVDEHGVESPVGVYSVETVGVDLAPLNVTALKNRRSTVSVKVIVEGHTRCLELSNPPDKEERRSFKQRERNMTRLEEMLMACRHSEVLFFFSGLNFSFIDETPREVICCALEEVSVYSPCNSSEFRFTLGHMQIDNMLDGAKYKVVLASSNSGRNSHLNEDFDRSTREAIPFLEIIVVPDADNNMVSSSGLILERLQINLQEITASIDFNFIVQVVVSVMGGSMRNTLTLMHDIRSRLKMDDVLTTHNMLIHSVEAPDIRRYNSRMAYLKSFEIHAIEIKLRLNVDVAEGSYTCSTITSIAHSTMSTLSRATRGLTNIQPDFKLHGISIDNAFDRLESLSMRIAKVYITQLGLQLLTILGSADVIGDPAGALVDLGTSVRLFVKKTKSELTSSGPYRGEGVRTLIQGIAGASFGTVAKVTSSLGIKLAAISGSDFKLYMSKSDPTHVGSGIYQAASVFAKSIRMGVTGVVSQPYMGIRQRDVFKTARGVVMGISGLALSPVVGILGATAKLSKGIESTTHLLDDMPVGRLRHARALFHHPQILPLHQDMHWTKLSLNIEGWKFCLEEAAAASIASEERASQCGALSAHKFFFAIEYGKQKYSCIQQELHHSGRIAAEDLEKFEITINPEDDDYAHKHIKVKCRMVSRRKITKTTFAKCCFHPLDLMELSQAGMVRPTRVASHASETVSYFSPPTRLVDLAEYLALDTHVHSVPGNRQKPSTDDDAILGPNRRSFVKAEILHENFIASAEGMCRFHRSPKTMDELVILAAMSQKSVRREKGYVGEIKDPAEKGHTAINRDVSRGGSTTSFISTMTGHGEGDDSRTPLCKLFLSVTLVAAAPESNKILK